MAQRLPSYTLLGREGKGSHLGRAAAGVPAPPASSPRQRPCLRGQACGPATAEGAERRGPRASLQLPDHDPSPCTGLHPDLPSSRGKLPSQVFYFRDMIVIYSLPSHLSCKWKVGTISDSEIWNSSSQLLNWGKKRKEKWTPGVSMTLIGFGWAFQVESNRCQFKLNRM